MAEEENKKTHYDFFGRELKIGDIVAFTAPKYRRLTLATVIAFTPTSVRVKYNNTWNYGPDGRERTYLSSPGFLIKRDP